MKKLLIISALAALTSCQQKRTEPEVKTAPALEQAQTPKKPTIQLASNEDPVCKMSVAQEYADTTLYNGGIYAFCGTGCKDEFVANPTAYLK